MKIRVQPEAEADLADAFTWYEHQSLGQFPTFNQEQHVDAGQIQDDHGNRTMVRS